MTLVAPSKEILKRLEESAPHSSVIKQDIALLKNWIVQQPHLPQTHADDWLRRFLSGCKYSVEKCKQKLDVYYTVRNTLPQFYADIDPTSAVIRRSVEQFYRFVLPECTPDGYRVIVLGILDDNLEYYDHETDVKRLIMTCDALLLTDEIQEFVVIIDCNKPFTMAHAAQILVNLHVTVPLVTKSMVHRMKQVHLLNVTPVVRAIVSGALPLLSEKLRKRVFFHTNGLASLYEHIPQELFPKEYGGAAGTIDDLNPLPRRRSGYGDSPFSPVAQACLDSKFIIFDAWQQKLEDMRDVLLKEYEKKTDESKRPKHCPFPFNDMFGVEGSFKTLNLD